VADRGVTGQLVAVDRSLDALAVAKRNAVKHRLLAVTFVASTWFESLDPSLRGHIDLVVSNPPYVDQAQREALAPNCTSSPRAPSSPATESPGPARPISRQF
jgi:release factor glutamine methyltransferase